MERGREGLGTADQGAGPRAGQGRQDAQGAARHKGQGRVARFHFEVFKAPKPQKYFFCNFGPRPKGKAGLQDSILRFSRPENPKITVLQLFEERGRGSRAGHASLACLRV